MSNAGKVAGIAVAACTLVIGPSFAAEYPERPITAIVPYGAGGPTDNMARLLSSIMEPDLGRTIIANRPGANGTLGIGQALRSRPDGYTIAYSTPAIMGLQPLISPTPFKTADDYAAIVKLVDAPSGLVVRADSPIRDIDDFIARAKREPGALRISVSGRLTEPDLTVQLFKTAAKIDLTTIPFTGGSAEAMTAVLGGHVEAHVAVIPNLISQVSAGKVRLLAVFAQERHPLFRDVPAIVERGYDVRLATMYFLIAPKDLDAAAHARLRQSFTAALQDARFQDYARKEGFRVEPLTGKALADEVAWYTQTYQKLIGELKLDSKQ